MTTKLQKRQQGHHRLDLDIMLDVLQDDKSSLSVPDGHL